MPVPSRLFSPLALASLTLPNRIAVSPMCQYSAEDGLANDWHLVHLGSRATGGAGLVIVEATAVTPEGRITPQDLGLWKDEQIEPLARITRFLHAQGAYAGIQLAHAGRKASMSQPWLPERLVAPSEGGWSDILAPSATAFDRHYGTPQALSVEGIDRIVNGYAQATVRALEAGFDLVEIHAAHGYLLHEFLSPLSNHRDDSFGGSFDNRTRMLILVVDAVREVWPLDKPLLVRLSATDWMESEAAASWTVDDSVALARILKTRGVDMIDVSSGGLVPHAKITTGPGYQVPFAERIRKEADIATAAVGAITDPHQAEAILAAGSADLVLLARELLRSPYWPMQAAAALEAEVAWVPQYARAAPHKPRLRLPLEGEELGSLAAAVVTPVTL